MQGLLEGDNKGAVTTCTRAVVAVSKGYTRVVTVLKAIAT
jgi:hypothetical protein